MLIIIPKNILTEILYAQKVLSVRVCLTDSLRATICNGALMKVMSIIITNDITKGSIFIYHLDYWISRNLGKYTTINQTNHNKYFKIIVSLYVIGRA